MRVIKGKHCGLWSAADILYFSCLSCGKHIPWRKYANSSTLVSSCCGYCFCAKPLNESSRFEVFIKEADLSNVIILSIVDCDYGA